MNQGVDSSAIGRSTSPHSARAHPVRTCVGCRARAMTPDLLRVVVIDGVLVPDVRGTQPGRGAWLHPTSECVDLAVRRRAFPRALRVPGPLDAAQVRAAIGEPD